MFNNQNNHSGYPQDPFDLVKISKEVNTFWDTHNIITTAQNKEISIKPFILYEGPPSANGKPGIHHLLSRTIKDIFARYKRLKGYSVNFKAGWDTHGLPIELAVEKQLGLQKEDIGKKISIENYNQQCKQLVLQYTSEWEKLTQEMGYWIDLKSPYNTYDKYYMESVWFLLKKFFDQGLLYQGYSVQPYSPVAGSGLSTHELNQPGCYREVQDTSVVAQFKIVDTENDYLLAWTTTPWTLPANSALAVNENIDYVKVKTYNIYNKEIIYVILAEALAEKYCNIIRKEIQHQQPNPLGSEQEMIWEVVEKYNGEYLLGMYYEPLFNYIIPEGKAFCVVSDDCVNTQEGTGILHVSPTFGSDDYRIAQKHNIAPITLKRNRHYVPIVDLQGKYIPEITDFAGKYVKTAYDPNYDPKKPYASVDKQIIRKLKKEHKCFYVESYSHNYPHCWRTDKPILYYPLNAWFIKTTAYKKKLLEYNQKINWYPKYTGENRFGKWLENLVDWNISRDRFWGTPLPIWLTKNHQEVKCIGSLKELEHEVKLAIEVGWMKKPLPKDFDLHKPYIDEVVLVSEHGKPMYRVPEVIDVWFDSGAMPYAQFHYPFGDQEKFLKSFPAHFVSEGVDQTRGWFFTLHVIAVILFDNIAFKNVISTGLVLDEKGNKMSKRLGNTIDTLDLFQKYGADTIRWYIVSNSQPWENIKFDIKGVEEVQRKFFNTLHNTYQFFAMYANLDNYTYKGPERKLTKEIDMWIISELNTLIIRINHYYDQFNIKEVVKKLEKFVIEDLSNWYVRLNRKRFWQKENTDDKFTAYQTLYTCLFTLTKLAASIAPFYMEYLYQCLHRSQVDEQSVHLSKFPIADPLGINPELEKKMEMAKKISSLAHALRKKHKIKVRQPLAKMLLVLPNEDFQKQVQAVESLILNEVNIEKIEYIKDTAQILTKRIKPNFSVLGKIHGSKMKLIQNHLQSLTQTAIQELETKGSVLLNLEGEKITINLNEVEIISESIGKFLVEQEGSITLALDVTITEALRKIYLARELVNRIQTLRKEEKLEIQDQIKIQFVNTPKEIEETIKKHAEFIFQEIQAKSYELITQKLNKPTQTIQVDQMELEVKIQKCSD